MKWCGGFRVKSGKGNIQTVLVSSLYSNFKPLGDANFVADLQETAKSFLLNVKRVLAIRRLFFPSARNVTNQGCESY